MKHFAETIFADQGNLLATPFTVKENFAAPNFRSSRPIRKKMLKLCASKIWRNTVLCSRSRL